MLLIIRDIYSGYSFKAADGKRTSERHTQAAGISQGCPLSPFLFVMLMSVLMMDAVRRLSPTQQQAYARGELLALLYVDDTLLVGYQRTHLQSFLDSVAHEGAKYGMELHWGKFQLLNVNTDMHLTKQDNTPIEQKTSMVYLGTTIAADGMVGRELSQRLGRAWAEFCKLKQFWKHISISVQRKIKVFNAVVTSTLLYSLSTVWLNARQQRQLDGIQARCLWCVLRTPPAFISRVSNKAVLEKSRQKLFSQQLLCQQLLLFGRIARAPDDDCSRRLTFCPGNLRPAASHYIRRIGRPHAKLAPKLMDASLRICCKSDQVWQILQDPIAWKRHVEAKC